MGTRGPLPAGFALPKPEKAATPVACRSHFHDSWKLKERKHGGSGRQGTRIVAAVKPCIIAAGDRAIAEIEALATQGD
jgi:hypothetical protein